MAELIAKIDETTGEALIVDAATGEPIRIDPVVFDQNGVQIDPKTGNFTDGSGAVVSIDYDPKSGAFKIISIKDQSGETKPPGDNPNPDSPTPPVNSIVDANSDFLKKNKIAPTFQNVSIQRGGNNGVVNMTNAFNRAAAIVGQKGTGAKSNSIFDPNAKRK